MAVAKRSKLSKSFWLIWAVEFWERFGYYGTQAIIALYFAKVLGYSQKESFYLFGAFAAFVYGFVWVGGFIGDKYLGAKRTLLIGAIILMLSYAGLALSGQHTVFYALAGIIVGNALFKANPSSLISKLYQKGDPALDGAMTMYYMAINIGSFTSMLLTPIVAQSIGWQYAFWLCSFGLFAGVINYFLFYNALARVSSPADRQPLDISRLANVLIGAVVSILILSRLLTHITICYVIVFFVVTGGFIYFLKLAFELSGKERQRMLIAFVLILQAIVFFVLYNQMPTSLTFFALHNIDNHVLGFNIPPAEYQALNPLVIIIMSPLLAWYYVRHSSTHVTKFCVGMSLCAAAFLVLWLPQFTATSGLASPWWLVLTYFLQSTGELLISGLGLAMVAELCPRKVSGFVMGIWFLTTMLAGPIAAWVGAMTAPMADVHLTVQQSMLIYTGVFAKIGLVTAIVAIIMWLLRPFLNRLIADESPHDPTLEMLEEPHVR